MQRYLILLAMLLLTCSPKYTIDYNRPVKPISFPRDHAAHNSAQMEWWYYTGHLKAGDGSEYGFEVTFFKRITNEDRAPGCLRFIPAYYLLDVGMIGHFAVTDLKKKRFASTEKDNFLFTKWKADPESYNVVISDWHARDKNGVHCVRARMKGYAIDLYLTPRKPAALNGRNGIVQKGDTHANYYYSFTNLQVTGNITVDGKIKPVKGKAWMDHEYGVMKLEKTQTGWDWFSLQLENNTELMIYLIKDNHRPVPKSGGTYVDAKGKVHWLSLGDITVKTLATWQSGRTKGVYPSEWRIDVKRLGLSLHIKPRLAEQELDHKPVTYWEGAVDVKGTEGKKEVKGLGYVELVGYCPGKNFSDLEL